VFTRSIGSIFLAALLMSVSFSARAVPASKFEGKPAFEAGQVLGAFVWRSEAGMHLRVTTPGKKHVFEGQVCSPKKIQLQQRVQLEKNDKLVMGPKGHCLSFVFSTAGGIDGLDFKGLGRALSFEIKVDDKKLSKDKIWIGSGKLHPKHNPFVSNRKK